MLSKGQILRARKAMERFYDGTCTITERQPYKRQNGSTGFRTVDVVTDQPCRLSYSSNFSADKGERASGKEQVIRVFMAPEVEVSTGSRITIIQNGRTDIVRFISDDYWSFPFLNREPCELFLNYPEVIWFSVVGLCTKFCGKIPIKIIGAKSGKTGIDYFVL